MKFLLVVVGAVAVYLSWPVSLWLGIAGVCFLLLDRWRKQEQSRDSGAFRKTLSTDLADVCLYVTAGIAVVVLLQVVLQLFGWAVPDNWVLWAEVHLSELRRNLAGLLSLRVQVFVWTGLLVFSVLTGIGAVTGYANLRKFIARGVIALNVACSFTFFSLAEVGHGEPQWVAKWTERSKVQAELDRQEERRKELIVVVALGDRIQGPGSDPAARTAVANLLTDVESDADAEHRGRVLANIMPTIRLDQQSAPTGVLENWTTGNTSEQPTLRQVAQMKSETASVGRATEQAEKALIELMKSVAGEYVGGSIKNAIVRSFVKAFTGAVVKERMEGIIPASWADWAERRTESWRQKGSVATTSRANLPVWSEPIDYKRVEASCCIEVTTVDGVTSRRRVCKSECQFAVGGSPF